MKFLAALCEKGYYTSRGCISPIAPLRVRFKNFKGSGVSLKTNRDSTEQHSPFRTISCHESCATTPAKSPQSNSFLEKIQPSPLMTGCQAWNVPLTGMNGPWKRNFCNYLDTSKVGRCKSGDCCVSQSSRITRRQLMLSILDLTQEAKQWPCRNADILCRGLVRVFNITSDDWGKHIELPMARMI